MVDQPQETWWDAISGDELGQGHLLSGVLLPRIKTEMLLKLPKSRNAQANCEITTAITVTQSCDWADAKRALVSQVITVDEGRKRGLTEVSLQDITDGRRPQYVALAGPNDATNKEECLLVDFQMTWSLPIQYLRDIASAMIDRPVLRSPYLEYFSAAFGRCFSRVALPLDLPVFIDKGSATDK